MKSLVVESDVVSRTILIEMLGDVGVVHTASNEAETVQLVETALNCGVPYRLICLDCMMPEMDGRVVLKNG